MSVVYATIIARAIIKAFASEAWMFYVGKHELFSCIWLIMTDWIIRCNCCNIGLLCFFYNEGNVNDLCKIKRNWKNQRCIVSCWKSITNWSDICLHKNMGGNKVREKMVKHVENWIANLISDYWWSLSWNTFHLICRIFNNSFCVSVIHSHFIKRTTNVRSYKNRCRSIDRQRKRGKKNTN